MYYSQCKEDTYLNDTFFHNKTNGVYIELGALDGVLYSNTKFFQDSLNWTGILIEPHPLKFTQLKKNRPNNFLFNDLVSSSKEELKFRFFEDFHAAVSGVENTLSKFHFDEFFDNAYNKSLPQFYTYIKPSSLSDIIKKTNITHIDFLSLDVEGHELEVLQSWDFSVPIDVILIEMLGVQPEKEDECRKLLIHNGYTFHSKFAHNEIYISTKISDR